MSDQRRAPIMPDDLATSAPYFPAARHVFVYGTLRAGGSNDIRRYAPMPTLLGSARLRGTLYDLGAYPGLRLDDARGTVAGEVWTIDTVIEPALDRLEDVRADGSGEYLKRIVPVLLGGRTLDCLVYELHPARIAHAALIAGGDWLRHLDERTGAPHIARL